MSSPMQAIEALLREFYQPATPNNRKHEIELELISYKSQPDVWQLCLRAAVSFEPNQFVWFFSTSTLEHAITRRWSHLSMADRTLLRETLWNTYASISTKVGEVPRCQRDTIAHLIALMGKREFPDDHPNYVIHCVELIKSKFTLGIALLRITSEEVVSNREDVATERKNYFHSCVSIYIPEIMDLITKYLLIAVCHINEKDIHSIQSNLMDYTLITSLPNDNQLSYSIVELLTCLQHLVSWIQTDSISDYFLMSILDLAQWRTARSEVSLAALSVLTELLYLQKSLPCAMTLMTGITGLLDQHNNMSKSQSEIYVDKFRELLRIYTTKYWPKMINEHELLDRFLKSLFYCTTSRNSALDFTEKLEIWSPIVRGLAANSKTNRYIDIWHQLVSEIMCRTQFEFNKAELELLDHELTEDNTQSEWQQFITQCIEFVALIAENRANAVFGQVVCHWPRPLRCLLSVFKEIEEIEFDTDKYSELTYKLSNLSDHLRDCTTLCQALVRIAPLLDLNATGVGADIQSQLQTLADNLLTILKLFKSDKMEAIIDFGSTNIQTDLEYFYAQVLSALRSILPLSNINLRNDDKLRNLCDSTAGIFLKANAVLPPHVYIAASELLLSISTVIRPKFLLELPTIINLMESAYRLDKLPRIAIANIHTSLIGYLILPWKNVPEQQQDYTRRCVRLRSYVESVAKTFLEVDDTNTQSQNCAKVNIATADLLLPFSVVICNFKDVVQVSKEMLAQAIKPVITKAMIIYNNFGAICPPVATTVAEFSLSMLRTLPSQLGAQFIKDMVVLFITVSSREKLTTAGLGAIEKIVQMFQYIVEQPGSASTSILPDILEFTIEQILPLIQHSTENIVADNSDISNLVYALFDSILTNKWQYFYKSQVQHNGSLQHTSSENLHPAHFMAIMNAYGQILVTGIDPNVRRTVLQSMQNVNNRWRLYQRQLFKDNLLASFQSALISVLLSGEGALHFELLSEALYAMGQVDMLKLRESFIKAGFPINPKTIDEICVSNDIPTFSQKLTQLMQDVHCAQLTAQT